MPLMATQVHCLTPPCDCPDCLRATAAADRRRAEIAAILRRLDEVELHITTADQLDRESIE